MLTVTTIFIKRYWTAVLASITACVFIFLFTRHSGIGISPDSVMYTSAAENIRKQFMLADFNLLPLVDFPAGYPAFLALITLITGTALLPALPIINAMILCGVLFLTDFILVNYRYTSAIYRLLFLAMLATSPVLFEVYAMAWSETLFIFWVMLFIVVAIRYTKCQSSGRLFIMAIVVAVACVTRYAGITLLVTGGFLVLFDGDIDARKKIRHLLLFCITGISLLAGNLVRNNMVAHNLTGIREHALRSPWENIYQVSMTIAGWFPFANWHPLLAVGVFLLIFIIGLAALVYRVFQQQYFRSVETVVACFFIFYLVFMITAASTSRFEDLSSRLLSPIYIPLVLLAGSCLLQLPRRFVGGKKNILILLILLLFAACQYHDYRLNAEAWEGIKDAGMPGYTEDSWTQSPIIRYLQKNKPLFSGRMYSNAPDAVYFLTGIHTRTLPHKEINDEVTAFLKEPAIRVIWLVNGDNPDLVGLDFIRQHAKQLSVQEVDGGAVYSFSGRSVSSTH